jgi:autotransporter-like protein
MSPRKMSSSFTNNANIRSAKNTQPSYVERVFKKCALLSALCSLLFFSHAEAYQIVSPNGGVIHQDPPVTTQKTANYSGDSLSISRSGSPAYEVGGKIVISLSKGATFADSTYTLEESAGGAGTGDLTFAVLETTNPSGSSSITFTLKEHNAGTRTLATRDIFILSGAAIAGQSTNYNLPQADGLDTYITFSVYNAAGALQGSARYFLFDNVAKPEKTPSTLNAIVSQSQATLMSKNIGARVGSMGNRPKSGPAPNQPSKPDTSNKTSLTTFTDTIEESTQQSQGYKKAPIQQLAMALSFDSSQMLLPAAQPNQRDEVLLPNPTGNPWKDKPITIWGQGSYTNVNNTDEDSRFNGISWAYNLGVDYRVTDRMYAGLSLGYTDTDLSTGYNNGTYDETSWSVSPYFVYMPSEQLKLSGLLGYAIGDIYQTRGSKLVDSSTNSKMWYANVNAAYTVKPTEKLPLELSSKVNILATNKSIDSYTDSASISFAKATSNTRQVKPGLEASYEFNALQTSYTPFLKTDYVYDFMDLTNNDKTAVNVGGGLRIYSDTTGFSGVLEGEKQLGRTNYKEYSISGSAAYSFSLNDGTDNTSSFIEPYIKTNFNVANHNYGTGLSYKWDNFFSASFGVDQTRPTTENAKATTIARLSAQLNF